MDRYWVGGTGNWDASTKTNWSASSGGVGGASVPTSSDNVIFDSLSNATAYTVTITATANCLYLTIGNPLVGAITFAGISELNVYGNYSIASGATHTHAGAMTFKATSGTKTITTNGVSLSCQVVFDGSGGTFQLADDWTCSSTNNNRNWTLTNGTFDPNGKTVTFGSRTDVKITGAFTFFNLTRSQLASTTDKTTSLILSNNIIVTGTFTVTGNSVINRLLIKSYVLGTARTITAATVTVTNADFQDITGAGAGSWNLSVISGNSGDCGGNSGITFTTPVTTTCSAGTTWSTATWSSRVPLPQDTATFSGSSRTITQDMPRIGSVDFTGSSGLTWTTSTTCSVFGSINLTNLTTLSGGGQPYTFEGRGSNTLNTSGLSLSKVIILNTLSGTLTLNSNLSSPTALNVYSGILSCGSNSITATSYEQSGGTINLGSGTHTFTGSLTPWNVYGGTVVCGTSTIILTYASSAADINFTGGSGNTYYNIWFNRGGAGAGGNNRILSPNLIFNDIKDTGALAHSLKFVSGSTTTVKTFTVNGTAGNLITLDSTTTAAFTLTAPSRNNASPVSCDYLNIQHCICPQANTWYAGANSVNNQGVATAGSGWIFTVPAIVAATNAAFLFLMMK